MEYTNERINKESEAESLGYFLEAYETIIGESFMSVKSSERPDFIATRTDGSQIGIELSKIRRGHPNDILYDKITEKKDYMSVYDALCMIQYYQGSESAPFSGVRNYPILRDNK